MKEKQTIVTQPGRMVQRDKRYHEQRRERRDLNETKTGERKNCKNNKNEISFEEISKLFSWPYKSSPKNLLFNSALDSRKRQTRALRMSKNIRQQFQN